MKKYLAIGHWRDSENITCVAITQNTMKDFRRDLIKNDFVAYVVLTEKKLGTLKNVVLTEKKLGTLKTVNYLEIYNEVQKLTSNYHVCENVTDYIMQCFDIIEEKMCALL